MNKYKKSADELKSSFKWVDITGKFPDELAMPYGAGWGGLAGVFREGEYENLKTVVEFVEQNIPQEEWRKGMNLIAQDRKQYFGCRPNPLHVAISEAEGVLRGYEKRKEMLKDETDYSEHPDFLKPRIPKEFDVYCFEKVEGLADLVSVLNDDSIRGYPIMAQIMVQKQR